MPIHDNGINALLITMGIITASIEYSDADEAADKKRNKDRPKYGTD